MPIFLTYLSKYYRKKRPLMLPDNLSPGAILQDKLEALIHLDKVSQEQKQG